VVSLRFVVAMVGEPALSFISALFIALEIFKEPFAEAQPPARWLG
jgi:hypothetical protein